MKVAIVGHVRNNFAFPLAHGLRCMFLQIGVEAKIFTNGLSKLKARKTRKNPLKYVSDWVKFYFFLYELRDFDVIVIVNSPKSAFKTSSWPDKTIRRLLPGKPIVLYSHGYRTRGVWPNPLDNEKVNKINGHWGLERYDWYFAVSSVGLDPMPKQPQPYSTIGVNLEDGNLRPEKKDNFIALIDFAREGYEQQREVQLAACEETNTDYIVLNGRYTINEIRKIYRRCSIYFIAFPESFGFPICELQAYGCYIFTPHPEWCQGHWLKEDLTVAGPGKLSPNFIVYDNDKERLVHEIGRVKSIYNSQTVFDTFIEYNPHLFYGDVTELKRFIEMVQAGQIHSKLHRQHANLT